jgi:Bacteriophage tail sheath protein
MPTTPTYPGVYIEELPSGVHTIVGVATSITAFVGRAPRGYTNDPIEVQSFADYERSFGGLWADGPMSYAVQQYFMNGGTDALVVRVHKSATKATITLPAGGASLTLEAASEGAWSNDLTALVDVHDTKDPTDPDLFNLMVSELDPGTGLPVSVETFRNISRNAAATRFITKVLAQQSNLVRVSGAVPVSRPDDSGGTPVASNNDGTDGTAITDNEILGNAASRTGIWALDKADLFNLLCIPPLAFDTDVAYTTYQAAAAYCKGRRAMVLIDPQAGWSDVAAVISAGADIDSVRDKNAILYFPRLRMADPLKENRLEDFVPCGVVAGICARTDAARGVWKAPAGQEATLVGVRELTFKMTDGQNGQLNPLGVNCLRTFPVVGNVVWGARTLDGADRLASEWKYVPVRRLALFLEETLYRGTQWVVFEPNDEPLWAQIRLNVGAFMHNMFRQGAFQGRTPREAYFVKCDKETTTQNDIDLGIVNIVVGFAPLKPAEFVIIKIQQLAGQIET